TAATLTGGTFTGPGNACPATGPDGTGRIVGTVGAGYGLAEIPGYGPVDDDTARLLAAAADDWVRVFTDPATGVPVNVDRYRPTTRQRLYLEARDLHCRFPGCRRPAATCDMDHTVAAADGGPTDLCNLACLCPRHHTLKHQTDWHVEQLPGGILKWTSPTRRTHTTRPPGTIRLLPDHPPGKEQHPAPF
ncbi:MAG TPA: HNH endonuclease signature motif containing protein, partial [Microbacterium sp.]|nr:HNH endonuclease signature motif containing protein [Microbacterium sp.]